MDMIRYAMMKKMAGGGGGGVSSWNDLTDKPFYDIPPSFEAIEWDGNTEGKETISPATGAILCRVSDKYLEKADVDGGFGEVTFADGSKQTARFYASQLTSGAALGFTDGKTWVASMNEMPFVVCVHSAENGFREGVYFLSAPGQMYVSRLRGEEGFKTLDPVYFPHVRIDFSSTTSYFNVTYDQALEILQIMPIAVMVTLKTDGTHFFNTATFIDHTDAILVDGTRPSGRKMIEFHFCKESNMDFVRLYDDNSWWSSSRAN